MLDNVHEMSDVSAGLQLAVKNGALDSNGPSETPVALIYDLDNWEGNIKNLKTAFGDKCLHAMALKSNSVLTLLQRGLELGLGAECASFGEVSIALQAGFPPEKIVFDSPVKTEQELLFAINKGIHVNIDNVMELERVTQLIKDGKATPVGTIGIRVNPLVGAGEIAALSVSTGDSKFGIPRDTKNLVDTYVSSEFVNCVHVHVGSGGMGSEILAKGVKVACELAKDVNEKAGREQIHTIDIGGGMPVNYASDSWTSNVVPSYQAYADKLRSVVSDLFNFKLVTEFGQSLNAKSGFLASRVEYVKEAVSGPIALIHFGADCCVRQVYSTEHKRQLQFYRADGSMFPEDCEKTPCQSVGGPLCFQGDFIQRNITDFPKVCQGDIVVMKDGGANTLALFSRHCSRLAPPVYGYRKDGSFQCLKERESVASVLGFWGYVEQVSKTC